MIKYLTIPIFLGLALAMTGCEPETKDIKASYLVPEELKDCSFSRLYGSNGVAIKVVRCPNSSTSTTYPVGKSTGTVIVVNGNEYVRKDKADE